MIDLKNPKIIQEKKEQIKQSKANKESTALLVPPDEIGNSNNSKYTKNKKSRNQLALDELLENKKNKVKKKSKTNDILFEENSILDVDLDNEEDVEYGSLQLSTMRPPSITNKTSTKKSNVKYKKQNNIQASQRNTDNKYIESNNEDHKNINSVICISKPLSISQFSELTSIPDHEIIKFLFIKGIPATINQIIDLQTAQLIAENFSIDISIEKETEQNRIKNSLNQIDQIDNNMDNLEEKAPVVAILGHVDHGKTTLLDTIRKTNLANDEAGGITQKLAAYEVKCKIHDHERKLIFLDTPGHKAFSAMRSRGANLTDIAILIIAADDGIQPQTLEAIQQIENANCHMIVALNKIDKPTSNPQSIINELTKYNIVDEKLGGNVKIVEISAAVGTNIDHLLSTIIEIFDQKQIYTNPNQKATGVIIESYLDKWRGPVTTLLVQNGTLEISDILVTNTTYGRIRAINNNEKSKIKSVGPSSVIDVLGLSDVANAGDNFKVVDQEKEARLIIKEYKQDRNLDSLSGSRISLISDNNKPQNKIFNLIVKADTQGTLEAILDSLKEIPQSKVQIGLIDAGLGDVKETDIEMANTTNAQIISFNKQISNSAKSLITKYQVSILSSNVIYDLLESIEEQMKQMLDPEYDYEEIGEAIVKTTFSISKGVVAGCFIEKGILSKGCKLRVIRGKDIVFEGDLTSLKYLKDDISEIQEGKECGVVVDGYNEWKPDDMIKGYNVVLKKATL